MFPAHYPPAAMLLAYADESYDQTYYWIAALICPEQCVAPLTHELDAVVQRAARATDDRSAKQEGFLWV